jgi:hypothetical protein
MLDAVRTLIRCCPLITPKEPIEWNARRMHAALIAFTALRPRDEVEVMFAVQAIAAFQSVGACFYLAMNGKSPNGANTRHLTAAGTAARIYDTAVKSLERRQAKPLPAPLERANPRVWNNPRSTDVIAHLNDAFINDNSPEEIPEPIPQTPEEIAEHHTLQRLHRIARENAGLDIANTAGILSCGGMIVPEDPTIQQKDYLERRLRILYMRELKENRAAGINKFPEYRPLRPGTYIP